ncbi:MAG: hypothetical protein ACK5UT_26940, partial [Acidobacteriota bacterium]
RLEATRGERNVITRIRLPPCESWSPECWPVGFRVARYVVPFVYDTVVFGDRKVSEVAELTPSAWARRKIA